MTREPIYMSKQTKDRLILLGGASSPDEIIRTLLEEHSRFHQLRAKVEAMIEKLEKELEYMKTKIKNTEFKGYDDITNEEYIHRVTTEEGLDKFDEIIKSKSELKAWEEILALIDSEPKITNKDIKEIEKRAKKLQDEMELAEHGPRYGDGSQPSQPPQSQLCANRDAAIGCKEMVRRGWGKNSTCPFFTLDGAKTCGAYKPIESPQDKEKGPK